MSIASMQRDRHAALASLFRAHRLFGTRSFVVDPRGGNFEPLKRAESLGWCWWSGGRCAITAAGLRELEPYRRDEPQPAVQWICPVCLDVVSQEMGDTGLPEPPHCPSCRDLTRQQIEELLTEQQKQRRTASRGSHAAAAGAT